MIIYIIGLLKMKNFKVRVYEYRNGKYENDWSCLFTTKKKAETYKNTLKTHEVYWDAPSYGCSDGFSGEQSATISYSVEIIPVEVR